MVINPTLRSKQNLNQLGFGLVELMVSISIMALVTSVILVKNNSYNGSTLLRSQAYEIALQLREVQLLSISATEAGSGFRNVYGVHFSTSTSDTYFIFRDAVPNDYFFDAGSEKFGKPGTLNAQFVIDAIRLVGSASTPEQLSITFERPNFDAKFYTGSGNAATESAVEIDVRTKGTTGTGNNELRTIEITRTGQITVK
jgi:prepilin-type N-terminal cleavage/methylation domain-containing protein